MAKAYSYVRFSSSAQERGVSLDRQLEGARKYAREHDLELDETMQDLGLSAFHGTHLQKGHLHRFMQLINEGLIEPGSVLIVENLDRLSRQEPIPALSTVITIVSAGIKLVTLQNGIEYTASNITDGQLYMLVGEIMRSHKESERKQFLSRKNWEKKRALASLPDGPRLTSVGPAWLDWDEKRKTFVRNELACETIKLIYDMKRDGAGATRIEHQLNKRSDVWVPPLNKKDEQTGRYQRPGKPSEQGGWRRSYIIKLLMNNRALIGEYRVRQKDEKGKWFYTGEVIPDYFPKAIEEDLFYAVQELIRTKGQEPGHGGGQVDKGKNLFVHRAFCGLCGSTMRFIDKGPGPKGGQYYQCNSAARKMSKCSAKSVRAELFTELFFQYFKDIDLTQYFPGHEEYEHRLALMKVTLLSYEHQFRDAKERSDNFLKAISLATTNDSRKTLVEQFEEAKMDMKDSKEKIDEQKGKMEKFSEVRQAILEGQQKVMTIWELLKKADQEQHGIDLRLQLRAEIQRVVERIEVFPWAEEFRTRFVEEIERRTFKNNKWEPLGQILPPVSGNKVIDWKSNNRFRGEPLLSMQVFGAAKMALLVHKK